MATSAQDRLNKLLPTRPQAPKNNTDDLHFSERELLEYKQRQQKTAESPSEQASQHDASPAEEDDFARARVPVKPMSTLSKNPPRGRSNVQSQQGHVPGLDPDQIVFLPRGVWRGGLPATRAEDDGNESDTEPIPSSHKLIGRFCVWSLVVKFPYKYMQDPESKVSRRFFASEKIYTRGWHVHYLFAPESYASKPLLLVPLHEVETLLQDIGTKFKLQMQVPPYPFQLSFYDDGTPIPQPLGTINSKDDLTDLHVKMPDPPADYDQVAPYATEVQKQNHKVWREKIERALEAEKKKKSAVNRKKQERRDLTVVESVNQLQRAQRYLGLKQLLTTEIIRPAQASDGQQRQQARYDHVFPGALDVEQPAPFPFEDQPIIISIDVESWENDHNIITEIGVSTLDTADLLHIAPGQQGKEWTKKIRSRHFRIKGREAMRNFKYVHGDPDMFQFGTSEFVPIDEVAEAVDSCFEFPYSAGFECSGPPDLDVEGLPLPRKPAVLDMARNGNKDDSRNLLLLGHDIGGDVAYLSQLGSFIFGSGTVSLSPLRTATRQRKVLSSIRERLDTVVLHKSLTKNSQGTSLVKLCHELDITAWYAHNAGNDARYTLEAFIKLVIKARQEEDVANAEARKTGNFDTKKTLQEIEKERQINAKMEAARQNIEVELSTYQKAGALDKGRQSPLPFFADNEASANAGIQEAGPDRITYEEATRRYLEKADAPLPDDVVQQFDSSWGVQSATEDTVGAGNVEASDDDYPY